MKKKSIIFLLTLWCLHSHAQNFISDSLMSIYVESGVANQNFMPEGKSKKDIRVGKWVDYTFEFIYTYHKNNDVVDEYFEHLLIQSKGKYSNGQKSGLWRFNAVEEGTFVKYHIADVTFIGGKKTGPITLFYSSGEKAAEGTYKNDLLQGTYTVFYKSGEVVRRYNIVEDRVQGILTYFYKTGEVKVEMNYSDGKRSGEYIGYYKSGAIKTKKKYVNDTLQGEGIQYYPNGQVQEESVYYNGKFKSWKYYYESGQLWVHKEYENGKYHNILELYDSSGNPLDFGTLKDGTGTVKYYTEDSKVYLIRTFDKGVVVNEERLD